jgi:hypothetical protein
MRAGPGTVLVFGVVLFCLITLFEQVPIAGILGAPVSVLAWIWLAREVRRAGGSTLDGVVTGAVSGLAGALSAWIVQLAALFGPDTPGVARLGAGLGTVGATIFVVLWPLIGALVCGGAAAVWPRGRREAAR